MGESNSYSVQGTESPEPTLEESAQAIDNAAAEAQQEAENRGPQTYTEERPEWLPEKFDSPQAMAEAYANLESKLGQPAEEQVQEEEAPAPETQQDAINIASEEWAETGELSDATYALLESQGLGRAMVDSYIAGQQAVVGQQQMELTNEIGGMQEYQNMSNWAAEHLSDEELEAYNETVESGTVAQAKFAIKALHSRFTQAGSPKLAQGYTNGVGVPPFESRAQVTAAMKDKRYDTDPAYRDEVLKRLARSNV